VKQRASRALATGSRSRSSSKAARLCPRELAKSTRSIGIGTSRWWKVILA
jgi:hypothetical protein